MSQNLNPVPDADENETTPAPQIYARMSAVMADIGFIAKDRKNTVQNYAFRGIDDVFAALQPCLIKHGVFFVPEVIQNDQVERPTKSGGTLIYTTLRVAYTFYAPDGSSVAAVVVGEAMDSGDKSSNKAMSAALKYAVLQIFCVPTEASEDADYHSPEPSPRATKAVTASAAPKASQKPPQAQESLPSGLASPEQLRAIGNLSKAIPNSALIGIMKDAGCVNQPDLTFEQAAAVISRLQSESVF